MTVYNFTIKLQPYGNAPDLGIVEIDPVAVYGYFERRNGTEGGGLWFEDDGRSLVLVDYDGVATLPQAIIDSLRNHGVAVDASFEG